MMAKSSWSYWPAQTHWQRVAEDPDYLIPSVVLLWSSRGVGR